VPSEDRRRRSAVEHPAGQVDEGVAEGLAHHRLAA
jgi:hypothetical protein